MKRHALHNPGKIDWNGRNHGPVGAALDLEAAFGYPRDFLENQFVYLVISPRANGLSLGVNLNPVKQCDFNCLYCEVEGVPPQSPARFDLECMITELARMLEWVRAGWLRQHPRYAKLPAELLAVRHVALSGDGEPTLSPHFVEAVESLVRLRAVSGFFKIVLVTNSTALDQPQAQNGLALLGRGDEIWAKLDAGTQDYLTRINGSRMSLEKILSNILLVARQRPVIIQGLFPAIDGEEPPDNEIREYAQRLKELKLAGAQIPLVQIYSATRPMAKVGCSHLPLHALSEIARTVRRVAGLRAEVF